jgi:hypothetical protein
MGCIYTTSLKKKTIINLIPNNFISFITAKHKLNNVIRKHIINILEKNINNIHFNADTVTYYPHFMIKFNNLDDFYCIDCNLKKEECVICMEDSIDVKNIKCCKKSFHDDCLKKWIKNSNEPSCPCCRHKMNKSLTIVALKCIFCRKQIYHHNPTDYNLSDICTKCIQSH